MENFSLRFQAETLCREIEACNDIQLLKEKAQELVRAFYLQKELFSKLIHND